MRRSIETWKGLIPEVVARGCRAQCEFCIADAQHDIIELFDANMNWANPDVLKVTAERDELLTWLRRIRNVTANAHIGSAGKALKAFDYACEAIAKVEGVGHD